MYAESIHTQAMRDRPGLHAEERIYQVVAVDIVLFLPTRKYSRYYHARKPPTNKLSPYDTINNQINNMNIANNKNRIVSCHENFVGTHHQVPTTTFIERILN